MKCKLRQNEVVNQALSCFPCSVKPVECLREQQKAQDMERERGRGPALRQREHCIVVFQLNLLMLVGVEPQMLELMQYALVHHIGKSLVPTTRN